MTVIADITVPRHALALAQLLEDFPEISVELERVVPLNEACLPMVWISGDDLDVVESALDDYPQTTAVDRIADVNTKTLFEVHWNTSIGDIVQPLEAAHASVLEATGTADHWDFRLRFTSHDDLSAFNVALTERGIPVTLRHLYNPRAPADESHLTEDQREMLLTLYRQGYFEVPRQTTLAELAEEWDVTDSALSQRLRRAVSRLIEQALLPDDQIRS